jgi:hypothetical protein
MASSSQMAGQRKPIWRMIITDQDGEFDNPPETG